MNIESESSQMGVGMSRLTELRQTPSKNCILKLENVKISYLFIRILT